MLKIRILSQVGRGNPVNSLLPSAMPCRRTFAVL